MGNTCKVVLRPLPMTNRIFSPIRGTHSPRCAADGLPQPAPLPMSRASIRKILRVPRRPDAGRGAPRRAATSPAAHFRARLSSLTLLAQDSNHLFATAAGPFRYHGRAADLPRFVFLGAGALDDAPRVCFLAGFDHRDLRPANALVNFIERLGRAPEDASGLDLTFFPIVNVAGLKLGAPPRPLASQHWGHTSAPEIKLLERDVRRRNYDGFVRVQSAPEGDHVPSLRVRAFTGGFLGSSRERAAFAAEEVPPIRVERGDPATGGPLTVSADGLTTPFEVTLRIPRFWSDVRYGKAAGAFLGRLLAHYRGFQAAGYTL